MPNYQFEMNSYVCIANSCPSY